VCEINDNGCSCFADKLIVPELKMKGLSGQIPGLELKESFVFKNAEIEYTPSWNIERGLDKIADYIKTDSTIKLTIAGADSKKEKNNTFFTSVGLARAAVIRQKLYKRGVALEQLAIEKQDTNITLVQNRVLNGITLGFGKMPIHNKDVLPNEVQTQLYETSLTVFFEKADIVIKKLKPIEVLYLNCIEAYMKQFPKTIITIVGHTDNIGAPEKNNLLGLKRANNAKKFIVEKFDINPNSIKTTSAGEQFPISDEQHRNRRVVIGLLKK